ncbi:MAG: multicopper oxidase domain-containing protein [Chrysiogenetes bacterium]|nr:multicopper oxidase domain-containing protein [Chrysiogenetes bacterium]
MRRLMLAIFLGALVLVPSISRAEDRHFEMTIEEVDLEVAPGLTAKVWAYNGQVPGPLIHVKQGDHVEVKLTNMTTLAHTIHWHGQYMTNNWKNDGVPDITQKAINPGESFTYSFVAEKPGSLWYHCHVNVPEHVGIRGMWGPIIIDPKEPAEIEKRVTKEAILMFSGWNSEVAGVYGKGGHPTEGIDYFSINGKAFPTTQPLTVKKGDVLRLRLFSVSSEVAFHLHGHDVLVTHKDGLPLESPYYADVIPLLPGERIDGIVEMNNPGLWITHDHIEHHVSNNGKAPGGSVLVVEYEGLEQPDWYVWKNKQRNPDFYMSETMKKGYGLFNNEAFKGKAPIAEKKPRRRKKSQR